MTSVRMRCAICGLRMAIERERGGRMRAHGGNQEYEIQLRHIRYAVTNRIISPTSNTSPNVPSASFIHTKLLIKFILTPFFAAFAPTIGG